MAVQLKQRDLFTKRWSKVKAPEPSELQVQMALIERLGWQALPNCVYFHVPNGELRDADPVEAKRRGAKLKAMGVLPGVLDVEFIWNDNAGRLRVLFLELKTKKGAMSDAQVYFSQRVRRLRCDVETAYSVDEATAILQRYGILPKQA